MHRMLQSDEECQTFLQAGATSRMHLVKASNCHPFSSKLSAGDMVNLDESSKCVSWHPRGKCNRFQS